MAEALRITVTIMLAFTALTLSCAVLICLPRRRPANPYANLFGDMPRFVESEMRQLRSGRDCPPGAGRGRRSGLHPLDGDGRRPHLVLCGGRNVAAS